MAEQNYDFCIASADESLTKAVRAALSKAGFTAMGEAKNIPLFLRLIRSVQPWLAVIDTELPPGNARELANIIEDDGLAAAIFLNKGGIDINSFVQLPWPVEDAVLIAVANTVCTEFARKKKMQHEIAALQKKLIENKTIDRAKHLLIGTYRINEEEAYRFLRSNSMQRRITLYEMAKLVINSPAAFSSQLPPL